MSFTNTLFNLLGKSKVLIEKSRNLKTVIHLVTVTHKFPYHH